MNNVKLSLVIPFYNDGGCPIPFVNSLKEELKKQNIENYELILVDDCSKDDTPKELISLKGERVKVILNKKNKDYGGAIMTGWKYASGEILGFSCGDGEVSAEDVVLIYKEMDREDDILKTIRLNRQDGLQRKIISKIFNFATRIRFNIEIPDINGYPLYFKKICYKGLGLDNVKNDWLFNIDLIRKMIKKGYKIRNISVLHKKRSGGGSKMKFFRIIKMIIKYINYQ